MLNKDNLLEAVGAKENYKAKETLMEAIGSIFISPSM